MMFWMSWSHSRVVDIAANVVPVAVIAGFYNKMPVDYLHEQLSLCLAHEALCKMFLIKVIL